MVSLQSESPSLLENVPRLVLSESMTYELELFQRPQRAQMHNGFVQYSADATRIRVKFTGPVIVLIASILSP